jgi:hypothetical protein
LFFFFLFFFFFFLSFVFFRIGRTSPEHEYWSYDALELYICIRLMYVSLYAAACALYYIAELVEEYLKTARRLLEHATKATLVINVALLLDRLPIMCVGAGIVAHALYFRVLKAKRFPFLDATSPEVLAALVGFVANTGLWLRYFWKSRYTSEYIGSFLLITTWGVPFVLSLCLAGGETSLPGAGGYHPYSLGTATSFSMPGSTTPPSGSSSIGRNSSGISSNKREDSKKRKNTWALRLFDVIKFKSQETTISLTEPYLEPYQSKEKI